MKTKFNSTILQAKLIIKMLSPVLEDSEQVVVDRMKELIENWELDVRIDSLGPILATGILIEKLTTFVMNEELDFHLGHKLLYKGIVIVLSLMRATLIQESQDETTVNGLNDFVSALLITSEAEVRKIKISAFIKSRFLQ